MATELAGFTPNEFRTYPIEEGGIIPLDLDETGQFYWNELVAKNVPLKDEPDKFESVNYLDIYSVLSSRHVISSVVEKSRTYVVEAVLERTE